MTEFLHPVHSEPSTAAAPDELETVRPRTGLAAGFYPGVPASRQTPEQQATGHERNTAALDDVSSETVGALSTRQLRVLVNQAYRLMDTDYPPGSALERYEMIVEELEHRAQQATTDHAAISGNIHQLKETFHDNSLYCRFELIIDGTIAAYVKYTMNGGQLVLIDGVEQPGFWDHGFDATLMRHVVLNAHKRRLSLIPRCPMAFTFLADNPQYQTLVNQPPLGQHPR
jgi:predicted GNAT family acetyltransferase